MRDLWAIATRRLEATALRLEAIAPRLLGKDPMSVDIHEIFVQLEDSSGTQGAQTTGFTSLSGSVEAENG